MIRGLQLLIIVLLITGCSRVAKYYEPVMENGVSAHSGGGCTAPGATYSYSVQDNIRLYVQAGVGENSWGVNLILVLEKDAAVSFEGEEVIISSSQFLQPLVRKISPFKFWVRGDPKTSARGHHIYYKPEEAIMFSGHGVSPHVGYQDLGKYYSSINILVSRPSEFSIALPRALVDGNAISIPEIHFKYVEKSYLMTCVQ